MADLRNHFQRLPAELRQRIYALLGFLPLVKPAEFSVGVNSQAVKINVRTQITFANAKGHFASEVLPDMYQTPFTTYQSRGLTTSHSILEMKTTTAIARP